MPTLSRRTTGSLCAALVAGLVLAASAAGAAPPVGPLPRGPVSTIQTERGQLVAIALPHRAGGKVWRIARAFDGKVVRQVSEGDVGITASSSSARAGPARRPSWSR